MRKKIQEYLLNLEADRDIFILYACEAGSRAWGFPSADSDYDIRFIYMKIPVIEHYLSLNVENMRDVIEYKNEKPFDFAGWDLRKALKLLKKCNPPLFEWFEAPKELVYWRDTDFVKMMKDVMPKYYSHPAMCYHYLHMARGNYRDYLQGDEVWRKKYLYVLRPMLAVLYLMEHNKVPPLNFEDLVKETVHSKKVRTGIRELLLEKIAGNELDIGPRIDVLSDYIDEYLTILESNRFVPNEKEKSWDPLNEIFFEMLNTYR